MSPAEARMDVDEVYAVPLADRWMVFAPETWSVAVVNHLALVELAECSAPGNVAPSLEALELWQTLTIPAGKAPRRGPKPSAKVVMMPTRACNIDCVHCDFGSSAAPLTVLDPRVAYPLIDYVVAEAVRADEPHVHVHFFGGEPLVARRCVEAIVAHTRRACSKAPVTPRFELTTNGVCKAEAVEFLGNEIDSVVVSLDGGQALHDDLRRHRDGRGTYDEVVQTVRQLGRYPCELCVRMCVTDRSVSEMARLAETCCSEFDIDTLAFEMLSVTEGSTAAGLASPDPLAFAEGVFRAESVAAGYGVRVVHGPSELEGPRSSSCPLGTGSLMLWPDGAITGCYLEPKRWRTRGLELSFGSVDAQGGIRLDASRVAAAHRAIAAKPRCERCFARSMCAGGCHVEQTPPGASSEYDERCRAIRLIVASRLLRRIGAEDSMEAVLGDPMAANGLAVHPDDRLRAWAKVV